MEAKVHMRRLWDMLLSTLEAPCYPLQKAVEPASSRQKSLGNPSV